METKMLSFSLKNDQSELDTLCQKVEKFGKSLRLPKKCIMEINLALDELFTNIISYGFRDHLEHLVKIQIMRENGTLALCVEDDGIPFNPLETQEIELPRDIEDCNIGGLGLHFVKKVMDQVCYERCEGRNKLTLKKAIERN
ncbi:MAG: ATP-binding protein [Desulfobacterales bacterium]|jgi:serine/threonine-protein kinase RsbW